jgi:hypothetical protein
MLLGVAVNIMHHHAYWLSNGTGLLERLIYSPTKCARVPIYAVQFGVHARISEPDN